MVRVKRFIKSLSGLFYILWSYNSAPKFRGTGRYVLLLVPGSSLERNLECIDLTSYDSIIFLNLSAVYWSEINHDNKIIFTGDGVRLKQILKLNLPKHSIWFFPNDPIHVDSTIPINSINCIKPKYRVDLSNGLITAKKSGHKPVNLLEERKSQRFGSLLLALSFISSPDIKKLDIVGLDFGSKDGQVNPQRVSNIATTYSTTPHELIKKEFFEYIDGWNIEVNLF